MPRASGPRRACAPPRPARRSSPSRSNSGSSDVPSTNDMTNRGGTSGGSPASSHSTSGTGTACAVQRPDHRAWRSTSRLRTGGRPGGATLTTTRRPSTRARVGQARGAAGQRARRRRRRAARADRAGRRDRARPSRHLRSIAELVPGQCEGKVALVTGASRGLGKAVAERFAAEGATVAITARTMEPDPKYVGSLSETRDEIRRRRRERHRGAGRPVAERGARAARWPR